MARHGLEIAHARWWNLLVIAPRGILDVLWMLSTRHMCDAAKREITMCTTRNLFKGRWSLVFAQENGSNRIENSTIFFTWPRKRTSEQARNSGVMCWGDYCHQTLPLSWHEFNTTWVMCHVWYIIQWPSWPTSCCLNEKVAIDCVFPGGNWGSYISMAASGVFCGRGPWGTPPQATSADALWKFIMGRHPIAG